MAPVPAITRNRKRDARCCSVRTVRVFQMSPFNKVSDYGHPE